MLSVMFNLNTKSKPVILFLLICGILVRQQAVELKYKSIYLSGSGLVVSAPNHLLLLTIDVNLCLIRFTKSIY